MRATPVLLFLAPCLIAANQPTFTYTIPADTTVAAIAVDAAEFFLYDRRMGERRKGERRNGVSASPRILSIAD